MTIKRWLAVIGSFVAGVSIGAMGLAALERRVPEPATTAPESGGITRRLDSSPERDGLRRNESVAEAVARPATGDAEDRWARVDEALAALRQRVAAVELGLAELAEAGTSDADQGSRGAAAGGMDQRTLVAAGVDPVTAAEVMRRQSRLEMQRLKLRDQAAREGWLDSRRYAEALRKLGGDAGALREEIGDDAYDRLLYLTGQPNRVVVASVIDESPAQMAGIQAGDLVLNYADRRVFAYGDLRNATRAGEPGEYVLVRIQRGADLLELGVPRGPLGIRLDQDQIDPDADWRGFMPE
jgi:hypothetical protein